VKYKNKELAMFKLLIITPILWLVFLTGLSCHFLEVSPSILVIAFLITAFIFLLLSSSSYVTEDDLYNLKVTKDLYLNLAVCSGIWLCCLFLTISLRLLVNMVL
jgi:hypothetical protein